MAISADGNTVIVGGYLDNKGTGAAPGSLPGKMRSGHNKEKSWSEQF